MKVFQIKRTLFSIRELIKIRGIALACILVRSILVNSDMAKAATNITFDKPVVLNGEYGVLVNLSRQHEIDGWWDVVNPVAPSTSLVDGEFLPANHIWQDDTVWWDVTHPGSTNNSIEIDLMRDHFIEGFVVQANDEAELFIEYFDEANDWVSAWFVPNTAETPHGMQTRPNWSETTEVFTLPTTIQTDRLRVVMPLNIVSSFYSVSEIHAFGHVVPEPSAFSICAMTQIFIVSGRMLRVWSRTFRS